MGVFKVLQIYILLKNLKQKLLSWKTELKLQ